MIVFRYMYFYKCVNVHIILFNLILFKIRYLHKYIFTLVHLCTCVNIALKYYFTIELYSCSLQDKNTWPIDNTYILKEL